MESVGSHPVVATTKSSTKSLPKASVLTGNSRATNISRDTSLDISLDIGTSTSSYSYGGQEEPVSEWQQQPSTANSQRAKEDRGGRGGRGRGRGSRGRGGQNNDGSSSRSEHQAKKVEDRAFDRHSATDHFDSNKALEKGWGAEDGAAELAQEELGELDATQEIQDFSEVPPASYAEWGDSPAGDVAANEGEVVEGEGDSHPTIAINAGDWDFDLSAGSGGGAEAATTTTNSHFSEFKPPVPEEDNTQTYEEYMAAQQLEKKIKFVLPPIRTANEGQDADSLWENAVQLKKKNGKEEEWLIPSQKSNSPKARKQKVAKIFLELPGLHHPPAIKRGGGRRGREKGNPDRIGIMRHEQNEEEEEEPTYEAYGADEYEPVVGVDDEGVFPALGA